MWGMKDVNSSGALVGGGVDEPESLLVSGFVSPPPSARPRVYWNWLNGFVCEAQLTKDLEEMRRQGIAGALIFDVSPGPTSRKSVRGPMPAGGPPPVPIDALKCEGRSDVPMAEF